MLDLVAVPEALRSALYHSVSRLRSGQAPAAEAIQAVPSMATRVPGGAIAAVLTRPTTTSRGGGSICVPEKAYSTRWCGTAATAVAAASTASRCGSATTARGTTTLRALVVTTFVRAA